MLARGVIQSGSLQNEVSTVVPDGACKSDSYLFLQASAAERMQKQRAQLVMKLKFKTQAYQTSAVQAVVDCFKGQTATGTRSYRLDRGQPRTNRKGEPDGRTAHLARGIWAVSGTGGALVRPVLLFVKPKRGYQPRFDMDKVAKRADATAYLERRIRYRLREAAGV